MSENKLAIDIGKRILSEANDLKRTISSLAEDLDLKESLVKKIINGESSLEESYEMINRMGSFYSIDNSDLYLIKNDCKYGIKIMSANESINSSRIFDRKDATELSNENKLNFFDAVTCEFKKFENHKENITNF